MDELSRMKENLYKEGSPILVLSGLLCAEGEGKYASLTFQSLSHKPISSVLVDVHVFDRANIEVEVIRDYMYLATNVARDQQFGADSHVEITHPAAVTIAVAVKRVAFTDDSLWDGSNSIWYENIPPRRSIEDELEDKETVKQFRRDFADTLAKRPVGEVQYVPAEFKNLWLCACGGVNLQGESICHCCGAEYVPQRLHIDNRVQIALNLLAHKKELSAKAEQARLEAEEKAEAAAAAIAEAERIAAEQREKEAQQLKRKRRAQKIALAITIPALVALGVYLYALNTYILPKQRYDNAKAMLEAGQLDEAITAFSALGSYGDSVDMIVEAKFKRGELYLEEGNYAEAIMQYEAIASLKDTKDRISEAKYRQALAELNGKRYAGAVALFDMLGDYKDAADQAALGRFTLAKELAVQKDFEQVQPYYEKLTGEQSVEIQRLFLANGKELYEAGSRPEGTVWLNAIVDPAVKDEADAVLYAGAMQDIEAKNLDSARQTLLALKDYSDSADQILRISYILGQEKLDSGAYAEAIPLFEAAGTYNDAANQIKECNYRIAKTAYDAGDYIGAIAQFNLLGSYSDAASMAMQAQYQLGMGQLNNGQVIEAYNTLYPIRGYDAAFSVLVSNSQFYIYVYDVGVGPNPLDEVSY